jgi:chromosomal replication initiation ATPase DnaA
MSQVMKMQAAFNIVEQCRRELQVILSKPVRLQMYVDNSLDLSAYLKQIIEETFGIEWKELLKHNRKREKVLARQLFCHHAATFAGLGCVQIAGHIDRDHTTVLHSWKCINDALSVGNTEVVYYNDLIKKRLSWKQANNAPTTLLHDKN